jgi:hypothetical protein
MHGPQPIANVVPEQLVAVNMMRPLDAALHYAYLGLPVFPVASVDRRTGVCGCKDGAACESVGKHPLVKWADRATTERDAIRNWWGGWKPDANIGIPTGVRSGLIVVDIDRQHNGHATREALAEAGYVFPPTLSARTRNGGWHFIYEAPSGLRVANTTAALVGVGETPGIDVRGDGGYIIVAPSVRPIDPDPDTGDVRFGHYRWVSEGHGVSRAPSWVVTAKVDYRSGPPSARPVVPPERSGTNPNKRATAALAAEVQRVADSRDHGRNNSLFQAAANLFEIVNTGHLSESEVRSELTEAASAVGLGDREIQQTLDAQWRRKQGVRRAGWEQGGAGPNQEQLGPRRPKMAGEPGWPGQTPGKEFER